MRWLWLCLLILCGGALADERSIYYVGVNDSEYRPFSWVENGQLQGIDRTVLDAFASSENIKLVYLPVPRLRAIELLRSGSIQLLYPDDHHWMPMAKQGMSFLYSDPAVHNQSGFFLKRECNADTELSRVGTLLGWLPPTHRQEIEQGKVALHRFATVDQLLEALMVGAVDSVYGERQFLESYIAQHHPQYVELDFCDELPFIIGDLRLSTLRHPEMLERFNHFLHDQQALTRAIAKHHRLPLQP